jgi:N-methylhydantoinase A
MTQAVARLAVDVGGTFVDVLLAREDGTFVSEKVLADPVELVDGIMRGVSGVLRHGGVTPGAVHEVVHATTRASNAVLERSGPDTALVTTRGFRDVLQIQRALRWSMYDIQLEKPPPLVPRSRTWEVTERLLADGSVHVPLDEDEARRVAHELRERGIGAVAVALLHSYRNPAHERRVREILLEELPDAVVSISSELSLQAREYERANTAVVNAYVTRLVADYLGELEARLPTAGITASMWVMQSSGGLSSVEQARALAVRTLESGPAAGVLAAARFGRSTGFDDMISFDMGGTTAKAALLRNGVPATTHDFELGRVQHRRGSGLPVDIPALDLVEVGTGGGSIAEVRHGMLRVGPRSAGASPGPACYGRGGSLPTVTDANLLLGYYDPERFAGGALRLSVSAAEEAVDRLADELGVDRLRAAWGIHQIATLDMERAIRLVSINRGFDPRELAFICLGGAGPTHGPRLARALGCRVGIVPPAAGVASTFGLLDAHESVEFARTALVRLDDIDASERCSAIVAELEDDARRGSWADGVAVHVRRSVGMRYRGQGHELIVPLDVDPANAEALRNAFHDRYERAYGYCERDHPVEAVTWYVALVRDSSGDDGTVTSLSAPGLSPEACARRRAFFPETGLVETDAHWRSALAPGTRLRGPCLVDEPTTTTVILPGSMAEVTADGTLVLHLAVQCER